MLRIDIVFFPQIPMPEAYETPDMQPVAPVESGAVQGMLEKIRAKFQRKDGQGDISEGAM